MIKINTSPIVHFANTKFIGFHTAAKKAVEEIQIPGFTTIAKAYEHEINNLYDFINDPKASKAKRQAADAKKVRDQEFAAFRLCVMEWSDSSEIFKRKLGRAIWAEFKTLNRIDHLRSNEISEKVKDLQSNILSQVCREPYASLYKGSDLAVQFTKLTEAETQYAAATAKFQEDLRNHEIYSSKDMRENCMEMFREALYCAKVMAEFRHNVRCMTFLDTIIGLVEEYSK